MIVLAEVGTVLPAHAMVSTHLAKECRTIALQAHPATLPDMRATANLRHSYYTLCIARHGKMDQVLACAR